MTNAAAVSVLLLADRPDLMDAVGAVGLGEFDLEERRDRSPWVLGLIVRTDRRGAGIGRALLARIDSFAAGRGDARVWVATGDRAVAFYRRCGWRLEERLRPASGPETNVLSRQPY
jgi:GNAT superfamily N-acetyltransferase